MKHGKSKREKRKEPISSFTGLVNQEPGGNDGMIALQRNLNASFSQNLRPSDTAIITFQLTVRSSQSSKKTEEKKTEKRKKKEKINETLKPQ